MCLGGTRGRPEESEPIKRAGYCLGHTLSGSPINWRYERPGGLPAPFETRRPRRPSRSARVGKDKRRRARHNSSSRMPRNELSVPLFPRWQTKSSLRTEAVDELFCVSWGRRVACRFVDSSRDVRCAIPAKVPMNSAPCSTDAIETISRAQNQTEENAREVPMVYGITHYRMPKQTRLE